MTEESVVSAMWHRGRKKYLPMTVGEIMKKAGVDHDCVIGAIRDRLLISGKIHRAYSKYDVVCDITEAGKELHQNMKQGE